MSFILRNTSRLAFKPLASIRTYIPHIQNGSEYYIHKVEAEKYAVSLSPKPDSLPMGYIYGERKFPVEFAAKEFQTNPKFLKLVHETIAVEAANEFSFKVEANNFPEEFMPIYDYRYIPNFGRIPEVDNTFGFVRVDKDKKIVSGSYEENGMYRVCNYKGLPKFSEHIHQTLVGKCESQVPV